MNMDENRIVLFKWLYKILNHCLKTLKFEKACYTIIDNWLTIQIFKSLGFRLSADQPVIIVHRSERQVDLCEFKSNLPFIMSASSTKATQLDSCLQKNHNRKEKEKSNKLVHWKVAFASKLTSFVIFSVLLT